MKFIDRLKSKHEVIMFFITTILFSWFLWFPALLIQNFGVNLALPYNFFVTVGTFVPSVTGFIFAYIFGGKAEVYSLFKSLLNIHIKVKWLLFVFLVLPIVSAVSCLIFSLSRETLPQMQFAPWFVPVAFAYIFIFMGPLGEEAGWRGFALKRLLWKASPMKSAVLIGIIWSFWHMPLFFINGTTQNILNSFGKIPAILGYLLYTVMISILITLLYIMSNGSVFGSMLLHAVGNLSLGIAPLIFSEKGAVILLATLFITVSVITYKYRKIMFRKV
ncbi:CPBP family intramembrane glutamic endopeptidase [Clostridium thermarum]|uniref:CPBP family intramembrane glutamic endopeptidase n=1 Tax=Clostridium thermarum TaxID=1716543 RepID=UPI001120DBCA|nr:type II CAAX endopeptidase family protein [Clostridium thermarum]